MSNIRDEMIDSLKRVVVTFLRKKGFKGSFPHFYRKLGEQTHLLMFQFSMYGDVMYVEVSKCSSEGYRKEASRELLPPHKVKVYQIGGGSPYNRTRIGKEYDLTFAFNEGNHDEVSTNVLHAFREAEEWWRDTPDYWNEGLER